MTGFVLSPTVLEAALHMTKTIVHISNLWAQRAVRSCALILACSVGLAHSLYGQAWLPPRGEGSVTLAYQHIGVRDHFSSDGSRADFGRIYSHSLLLLADYGLTNSLAVNLSVPYVRAKYVGDVFYAHKPSLLAFPNNAR